jgi:hypothetical protein
MVVEPMKNLPPDIVISPGRYASELENAEIRAVRASIPGRSVVSGVASRRGLLIAISNVHLRLKSVGGRNVDVQMNAGQTRWIEEAGSLIENLGGEPCEFLFIESKR